MFKKYLFYINNAAYRNKIYFILRNIRFSSIWIIWSSANCYGIDWRMEKHQRQKMLKDQYGFICNCFICKKDVKSATRKPLDDIRLTSGTGLSMSFWFYILKKGISRPGVARLTLVFEAFLRKHRYFRCSHWSNAERQAKWSSSSIVEIFPYYGWFR